MVIEEGGVRKRGEARVEVEIMRPPTLSPGAAPLL